MKKLAIRKNHTIQTTFGRKKVDWKSKKLAVRNTSKNEKLGPAIFLISVKVRPKLSLFMVAVWNRADHYIFALWFLLSSFFFFLA